MAECISGAIHYIEWPARDLTATKRFFEHAFDWSFQDYGDHYTAFSTDAIDGGFFRADIASRPQNGAALVVFFVDDLEATEHRLAQLGATITQSIFEFPGGRRFHFTEPSGNEFAVWSHPS